MKISGGLSEDGTRVGNTFDKYQSRNPLVRKIMHGFDSAVLELLEIANPGTVHEVGCGEGYWVLRLLHRGIDIRGSDFSATVIDIARRNARDCGASADIFKCIDIYELDADRDGADLVMCCEVLEHLDNPEAALQSLQNVVRGHGLFSVPREPLWSALNMARGKYWSGLGNTPGHVQRWSHRRFVELVSGYFDVVEIRSPLPWTMLLCTKFNSTPRN